MFPAEPVPDVIGTYKILRRLPGAGAAEVYLAKAQGPMGFERECELKLLPDASEGDPTFAEELAREAAICAKLNNPAVVRVFDFFEHGRKLVLVLEHVDGVTLAELQQHAADQHQRIGDAAIYFVGARIAGALGDAHAAKDEDGLATPIVHRNLSPDTVLVSSDGDVRLTGFGVGKILGRTPDTAIGRIKGTPGYMAPEQARGEPVTTKADVYGLGLLLWSLLTARRPPTDGTWPRHVTKLRTDLPREVAALVDAALDHFPGTRKITAREIEQWLSKAAPLQKAKTELRQRVAALRAAPREPDEGPPSSRRAIAATGTPYRGVTFGDPSAASTPGRSTSPRGSTPPPARKREDGRSTRPARTATATGIGKVLRSLPAPPPLEEETMLLADEDVVTVAKRAEMTPLPSPVGQLAERTPDSALLRARDLATAFRADAREAQRAESAGFGAIAPVREAPMEASLPPLAMPGPTRTPSNPPVVAQRVPALEGPPAFETPIPAAVTFGPPPAGPPLPTPAPPFVLPDPPPRRAPLPSLLTIGPGRRSLSAFGAILVSAVTATIVVSVALGAFVRRDRGAPATAPTASMTVAPSAPPAQATPPPTPTMAQTATPAPAATSTTAPSGDPSELPFGYGYLTVLSPANANVYISGKLVGAVNKPIRVRCGRWFIRLAATQEGRYPEWVTPGETALVPCQQSVRLEMNPRGL